MSDNFHDGDRVQHRTDGRVGTIKDTGEAEAGVQSTLTVQWDDAGTTDSVDVEEIAPV